MANAAKNNGIAAAEGPAVSFAGVFDLDLTLGDMGPLIDCMSFFFPDLYFDDGVLTFPASMREGLNNSAAEQKLQKTWEAFKSYKSRAYTLFVRFVLTREIQLQNVGANGHPTRGCLMRPGLFHILYTLKQTPGCQGLMILSNNTLRPCVEIANYLLYGLGRYFGVAGAEAEPPFHSHLLLHHGHRFREMERTQQEAKTGENRNNTLKSLWTVKEGFSQIGKAEFATLLGEPALPYAGFQGGEEGAIELPNTERIFFADDLTGHQLQSELVNEEAQFMNCVPYETQTRAKDLLAGFWRAWLTASREQAGVDSENPLKLFNEYFEWLLSRNLWNFGPLLVAGTNTIPRTPEERAELYQRRCSQYTFGVKEKDIKSNPEEYPTIRAYSVWKDDVLNWMDKLSMFSEALEGVAPNGGARRRSRRYSIKKRNALRKNEKTKRKKYLMILSSAITKRGPKKVNGTVRRRRTGLTISRHAL